MVSYILGTILSTFVVFLLKKKIHKPIKYSVQIGRMIYKTFINFRSTLQQYERQNNPRIGSSKRTWNSTVRNLPRSHPINRLFVFENNANTLSPT